ncbi:MAG: hypothetical protein KKH61_19865 [Gammaproteobacteria bacterium]|nr:hypothetical protein [Gammaproteobacteria bacterium]
MKYWKKDNITRTQHGGIAMVIERISNVFIVVVVALVLALAIFGLVTLAAENYAVKSMTSIMTENQQLRIALGQTNAAYIAKSDTLAAIQKAIAEFNSKQQAANPNATGTK